MALANVFIAWLAIACYLAAKPGTIPGVDGVLLIGLVQLYARCSSYYD